MLHRVSDWTDAYSNGVNIAGSDRWPAAWQEPASTFRDNALARGGASIDLEYGPGERHRFDLFLPSDQPARGLVVFVHGGYWVAFDKSSWSHLAAGPLDRGYAVAIPSYTLCPQARLAEIKFEIADAITAAAARVEGPLRLVGHSAGGHLVTRMVCVDTPLTPVVMSRLANVVSISGLHDLRPLLKTGVNDEIRLDAAEAAAESPALLQPVENLRLICWAGAAERAEFRRQNALLANIWRGLGAATDCVEEPDRHHFSIVDGLSDRDHALTRTLLDE